MHKWLTINEFRWWDSGGGVVCNILNFRHNSRMYELFADTPIDLDSSIRSAKISTFISEFVGERSRVLAGVTDLSVEVDDKYFNAAMEESKIVPKRARYEIDSLSKVSKITWSIVGLAKFFFDMLPNMSKSFSTLYQTYLSIEIYLAETKPRVIGTREITSIASRLNDSALYRGIGAALIAQETKIKALQVLMMSQEDAVSLRSLEYTSRTVGDLAPDSFVGNRVMMQELFERIIFGGSIPYRTEGHEIRTRAHLQNTMIKVWGTINSNPEHHEEIRKLFKELTKQGLGPSAADVIETPIGAILSSMIVKNLDNNVDLIVIGSIDKITMLRDIYVRLACELDDYRLDSITTRNIIDRVVGINNEVITDKLLSLLETVKNYHLRFQRKITKEQYGMVGEFAVVSGCETTAFKLLVIGDSVSAGFGLGDEVTALGGEITYQKPRRAAAMSAHHGLEGIDFINVSIVGATTEDGKNRIAREMLLHDPQVVILAQGGNDVLLESLNASVSSKSNEDHANAVLERICDNWAKTIRRCVEHNPDVIVVLSFRSPDAGFFTLHALVNEGLEKKVFAPLKRAFTDNVIVMALPDEPFAFNPLMRLGDNVHLTSQANQILAERMILEIRKMKPMIVARVEKRSRITAELGAASGMGVALNEKITTYAQYCLNLNKKSRLDELVHTRAVMGDISRVVGDGAVPQKCRTPSELALIKSLSKHHLRNKRITMKHRVGVKI